MEKLEAEDLRVEDLEEVEYKQVEEEKQLYFYVLSVLSVLSGFTPPLIK